MLWVVGTLEQRNQTAQCCLNDDSGALALVGPTAEKGAGLEWL
jgi:hypothetical protein